MTLPTPIPVMPLPDGILFPRVLMPLHIFEPRYRTMLEELNVRARLDKLVVRLRHQTEQCALWKNLQGKLGKHDVGRN